ncbi:hypothetical protein [uncultured Methylophaga sp.]|uniref:hypothetical protein n=1 Tax=uncultured Methylophaga sp. TaxID=285271 RepID=UPI0026182A32|nr:hypothetical protein [uncultured Methylophaga sp.]
MKPQATITQSESVFHVSYEENDQTLEVEQAFDSYEQALDFILEQGWQLKREKQKDSLHVETRFIKP